MIDWLFDRSMGCPGPEGDWPAWLSVGFHASHAIIAIVFSIVPYLILSRWAFRRDGITAYQFWSVMSLFLAVAAKSYARVLEIWGPPYHLVTLVDVATAGVLVWSVPNLMSVIDHALKLPSRAAIHDLADRLQAALIRERVGRAEEEARCQTLLAKLAEAEAVLCQAGWTHGKAIALAEIRGMLQMGSGVRAAEPARGGDG